MKRVVVIAAGGALVLSLAACEQASRPAGDAVPAQATAADRDAVKKVETELLAAIETKDVAKVKALYAPDAVMVLPMDQPFKGVAAIAAEYAEFSKDPVGKFDANNESTVVGADMAYSQGTYTVTYTDSETKKVENGQGYYVIIYRKQQDGGWKVVQDLSVPTPPAA